jgi:hypothetical protein
MRKIIDWVGQPDLAAAGFMVSTALIAAVWAVRFFVRWAH